MRASFSLVWLCLFCLCFINLSTSQAQSCIEVETLPVGTYATNAGYPFGTPFHTESNANLELSPYYLDNGSVKNTVFTQSGTFFWSGAFVEGSGQVLRFLETGVKIDFTSAFPVADNVSFDFLDWDGDINLSINGEQVYIERTFSEIPTQVATYVTMTVIDVVAGDGGRRGSVSFSGPIYNIVIGGNELGVDNICFTQGTEPACTITSVTAEPLDCQPSDGTFNMLVDYHGLNTSENIDISINNTSFGTFPANAGPYSVGPLSGTNNNGFVVQVTDAVTSGCSNLFQVDPVNCEIACDISDLTVSNLICTGDNTYQLTLDFNYVSAPSATFVVVHNNDVIGNYNTNAFPITIENLFDIGSGSHNIFVYDAADENCTLEIGYSAPNCRPACEFTSTTAIAGECNPNGQFPIIVDIEGNGFANDFVVIINDEEFDGLTTSDFPVTLGAFTGDGITSYEVLVLDNVDDQCFGLVELDPVSCNAAPPCELGTLQITVGQCSGDDLQTLVINFDYGETNSGTFYVNIDGNLFGQYSYNSLPLTLTNVPASEVETHTIIVCDPQYVDCCTSNTYQSSDCTIAPCSLSNITANPTICTGPNIHGLTLDFNVNETNSGAFVVRIDGEVVGQYNYNALPLTLGEVSTSGTATHTISVCDAEFVDCCINTTYQSPDCTPVGECSITNLIAEPIACTGDDAYSLVINFNHQNTTSGAFIVSIGNTQIGPISYAALPLTINSVENTDNLQQTVSVCDSEAPNCCASVTYQELDCAPMICNITEVWSERMECHQGDFVVMIGASYINPGDDGFTISDNGENYGNFAYTDLPVAIGPFEGDGSRVYEFILTDVEFGNCSNETTVPAYNCMVECTMGDLTVTTGDCNLDGTIAITLSFQSDNNSGGFTVMANNTQMGNFEYADGPATIILNGASLAPYNLTVSDNEMGDCSSSLPVGPFGCVVTNTQDLTISDFNIFTNQATTLLNISLTQTDAPAKVAIYNIQGQRLHTDDYPSNSTNHQVDISHLSAGLYICEIIQDGKKAVAKFNRFAR